MLAVIQSSQCSSYDLIVVTCMPENNLTGCLSLHTQTLNGTGFFLYRSPKLYTVMNKYAKTFKTDYQLDRMTNECIPIEGPMGSVCGLLRLIVWCNLYDRS